MESIITLLQSFELNILEVMITAVLVFIAGFWLGKQKERVLNEKIYELQRDVLDLNAEVLFGKTETPVIEIKHEALKSTKVAR